MMLHNPMEIFTALQNSIVLHYKMLFVSSSKNIKKNPHHHLGEHYV